MYSFSFGLFLYLYGFYGKPNKLQLQLQLQLPASSAMQCTTVTIQINKEHTCCCACTILRIVCLEYALDLTSISVKAPFATALMKASLQSATDAVCGTVGSSLFTRLVECSWNKH